MGAVGAAGAGVPNPLTVGLIPKVGGGRSPVDKLLPPAVDEVDAAAVRAAGVVANESALNDPLNLCAISADVKLPAWTLLICMTNSKVGTKDAEGKLKITKKL